MYLYTHIAIPM